MRIKLSFAVCLFFLPPLAADEVRVETPPSFRVAIWRVDNAAEKARGQVGTVSSLETRARTPTEREFALHALATTRQNLKAFKKKNGPS